MRESTMTMEELEARRRQLSFELGQGREEAEVELTAVEDQLARLKRNQERAVLAEQEGSVRAQEKARADAEQQREALQAKLERLFAVRLGAARDVEAAMSRLETAVAAYLAAGNDLYAVSAAAGRARPRLVGIELLAGYIGWRLSPLLPHEFHRPANHAQRRGLVELLGGEPTSATAPPKGIKRAGRP